MSGQRWVFLSTLAGVSRASLVTSESENKPCSRWRTTPGRCRAWCGPSDVCTQTPSLRPEERGSSTQEGPHPELWVHRPEHPAALRHPSPTQPLLGPVVLSVLQVLPGGRGHSPVECHTSEESQPPVNWPPLFPGLPVASHLGQFMGSRTTSRVQFPALVPVGPKVLYNLLIAPRKGAGPPGTA